MELIFTSEFFKKLKLHEPLRRVQFQLFEKLTSKNWFHIERQNSYDYLLIIQTWKIRAKKVPGDVSWSHCFSHSRKPFLEFLYKILVIALHVIIGLQISHCLSTNHNRELRCVISTGVTLFALVLHVNCTALSQSESINFFMSMISDLKNTQLIIIQILT